MPSPLMGTLSMEGIIAGNVNSVFQHSLSAYSLPCMPAPLHYLLILLIHLTRSLPITPSPSFLPSYTLYKIFLMFKPSESSLLHSFSHSTVHPFVVTPITNHTHTLSLLSISFDTPHAPLKEFIFTACIRDYDTFHVGKMIQ